MAYPTGSLYIEEGYILTGDLSYNPNEWQLNEIYIAYADTRPYVAVSAPFNIFETDDLSSINYEFSHQVSLLNRGTYIIVAEFGNKDQYAEEDLYYITSESFFINNDSITLIEDFEVTGFITHNNNQIYYLNIYKGEASSGTWVTCMILNTADINKINSATDAFYIDTNLILNNGFSDGDYSIEIYNSADYCLYSNTVAFYPPDVSLNITDNFVLTGHIYGENYSLNSATIIDSVNGTEDSFILYDYNYSDDFPRINIDLNKLLIDIARVPENGNKYIIEVELINKAGGTLTYRSNEYEYDVMEAEYNNRTYKTLAEAIDTANKNGGGTITLLYDVDTSTSYNITSNITLDGKKNETENWKITSTAVSAIRVSNGANFTMQNIQLAGQDKTFHIVGAAKATIKNSILTGVNWFVYAEAGTGSLTIINSTLNSTGSLLMHSCSNFALTVSGSTLDLSSSNGVIWASAGSVSSIIVEDSTLKGVKGIFHDKTPVGTITFDGVTFEVTSGVITTSRGGLASQINFSGNTTVKGSNTLIGYAPTAVSFADYTAENFIVAGSGAWYVYDSIDAALTAGHNLSAIRTYNDNAANAAVEAGYVKNTKNDNGTYYTFSESVAYTVAAGEMVLYATLTDAVNKAFAGDTIYLTKSFEENAQINITKSLTIDGGAMTKYTITTTASPLFIATESLTLQNIQINSSNRTIIMSRYGDLNIKGSNITGSGRIISFDNNFYGGIITVDNSTLSCTTADPTIIAEGSANAVINIKNSSNIINNGGSAIWRYKDHAEFHISNSTVKSTGNNKNGWAVRLEANTTGDIYVDNSEISSPKYAFVTWANNNTEITNGSKIISTGQQSLLPWSSGTFNISNSTIQSNTSAAIFVNNNSPTIKIYNGTNLVSVGADIITAANATVTFSDDYSDGCVLKHDDNYTLCDSLIDACNKYASSAQNNVITLFKDINLNENNPNQFDIINITKNLTIDGRGRHKIIGEHADTENPKNQFQSIFYVKGSDITFTLKNIEIDYKSYITYHYHGMIIYNANANATINIENSTLVSSKGIYSNNADSTINILESTIIGTMGSAIIISSVLSNTRTQNITIDRSFIAATGHLGCITIADSNTNLVIKGGSIIDPNINNYVGYESLAPTVFAIYVAAGLNNEAEYYPIITIYDNSKIYNGHAQPNGKYYGAIYSNGDNFTRPINVQFGDNYEGPAFICNAVELTSGQLFYGYFYDEASPIFKSFDALVPDNFGNDIYVLLANDTNIDNTITLSKNLHLQKATIVDTDGNTVEKEVNVSSSVSPAFTFTDDYSVFINDITINANNIVNGFANIAYKTGNLTFYIDLETALNYGYRIYAMSDSAKAWAEKEGYEIRYNDNNGYNEVIRPLVSYFKDNELNIGWNLLVNTTNYITQSKNNYGIKNIHDALINYTKLAHTTTPSKVADYMKGIAVCARYLAGKKDYVNGSDYLDEIVENLRTEP